MKYFSIFTLKSFIIVVFILLFMDFRANMGVVKSNIDVLVKEGLGERAENDFILARDTCLALLKLGPPQKGSGTTPGRAIPLPPEPPDV